MTKLVAEWLDELGFEVESTVSKKVAGAEVKKKYKPSTFGFDRHGQKIARVAAWAVAELDGQEYQVVVHVPNPRGGKQKVGRTHYCKLQKAGA